jgi:hypothetical protein
MAALGAGPEPAVVALVAAFAEEPAGAEAVVTAVPFRFWALAEAVAAPLGDMPAAAPPPVDVAVADAEPFAPDTADAAAVAAPPASKTAPPTPRLLPAPPCPPVEFAVAEAEPVALDAAAFELAAPPLPPVPGGLPPSP